MEKLIFALDVDEGWPPVAAEAVWCGKSDDAYQLASAPFFIKGLAVGDVFEAAPDPVSQQVFHVDVVSESGHSLIWILDPPGSDTAAFRSALQALGCVIGYFERGATYAVDIPSSVDKSAVCALIDTAQEAGAAVAFPVWRHEAGGP